MIDTDPELERRWLAAAMLDWNAAVSAPVDAACFSSAVHRAIAAGIASLREAGFDAEISVEALQGELRRLGAAQHAGEVVTLARFTIPNAEREGAAANIRAIAERLRELAAARECIAGLTRAAAYASSGDLEGARAEAARVVAAPLPGAPALPARFLSEHGVDDVLAVEPPPRRWLLRRPDAGRWPGWLPAGVIAMLAAAGGVGKTTLSVQLALAVATGRTWCGMRVEQSGSVLLALAEEDEDEVRRKLHFASRALELDEEERRTAAQRISVLSLVGRSARLLEGERGRLVEAPLLHGLRRYLGERADDWRLVVLDPFARFCPNEAEVDNAVASEAVRAMASLCRAPGEPTALVLHHINKAARGSGAPDVNAVRGAGALTDEARWAAVLWPDDENPLAVHLACRKSNYAPPGPRVTLHRDRGGILRRATVEEEAALEEAA